MLNVNYILTDPLILIPLAHTKGLQHYVRRNSIGQTSTNLSKFKNEETPLTAVFVKYVMSEPLNFPERYKLFPLLKT